MVDGHSHGANSSVEEALLTNILHVPALSINNAGQEVLIILKKLQYTGSFTKDTITERVEPNVDKSR